jgi:predicted DNA-binding transcriptional regulator
MKKRSTKKRSAKRSYQRAGGMLQKLGLKKETIKKPSTSENLINFRRSMRVQEIQDEIDNVTEKMNVTMNLNDLPRLNLALKRLEREKEDLMEEIYKSTKN